LALANYFLKRGYDFREDVGAAVVRDNEQEIADDFAGAQAGYQFFDYGVLRVAIDGGTGQEISEFRGFGEGGGKIG